ncbi:MAG: hypothetical protein JXR69_00290 [Candidatus Delongbacteria bacterium]|nr:hypothetical protein [Candidatus Delongbacteria bacterium]
MNYYQNRRTIRLKNYDYGRSGLYFITICTEDHQQIFGKIINKSMVLNNAGLIVQKCWLNIPKYCLGITLHEYIIMPNHIHGIIEITKPNAGANNHSPEYNVPNNNTTVDEKCCLDLAYDNRAYSDTPLQKSLRSPSKTIGSIVRGFKIGVMKWFRENMTVKYPVGKTIWQRNYHDQIIWNDNLHKKITEYIKSNVENWDK